MCRAAEEAAQDWVNAIDLFQRQSRPWGGELHVGDEILLRDIPGDAAEICCTKALA